MWERSCLIEGEGVLMLLMGFLLLVVLGDTYIAMECPPGCEKKLYILLNKIFCLLESTIDPGVLREAG